MTRSEILTERHVYATQVEALRRLRHGGSQIVRVEHVHVNEGGQAVIGNVKSNSGSGGTNPLA
jgi:hypothetical protein